MNRRLRVGRIIVPFLVVVALLYLPKLALESTPLYQSVLTERVLLVLASTSKLLALGTGSALAARCALPLDRMNPVRAAWWLMSVWLGAFFVGQAILSAYDLVLHVSPPLPSIGDGFFLVGYIAMIAAALRFVGVYRNSGFPVGHRHEHAAIAMGGAVAFALLGYALLAPIARAPRPLPERLITIAYPVLDFVVLVPLLVLLRITLYFRGGRVWSVWATLMAGFAAASVADIVFGYVSSIGERSLQPLMDTMFIGSYFLLACGAALQRELLTD